MKRLLLISLCAYTPLHSAAAATSIVLQKPSLGPISANIVVQVAQALVFKGLTPSRLPREPFIAPCDSGVTLLIAPSGDNELDITVTAQGCALNKHTFVSLKTLIYDNLVKHEHPSSGVYNYGTDDGPKDQYIFVDGNAKVLEFGLRADTRPWYAIVRTHIYKMQLQEAFNNYVKQLPPDLIVDESKDDSKRSVSRGLTSSSASALRTPVATAPSTPAAPPV